MYLHSKAGQKPKPAIYFLKERYATADEKGKISGTEEKEGEEDNAQGESY